MARRLTALLITTAVMIVLASTATAHGSTVFYTACDGLTTADTVKVKKIEEDGSGAATVADTGIAYCAGFPSATTAITGLAIHDGHAYFSWVTNPAAATGIGRVSLNGGTADLNFIPGPANAKALRLNANPTNGHLYAYADDTGFGPVPRTNPRVVRVPVSGGAFEAVIVPGSPNDVAFGIANSRIYYTIMGGGLLYEADLDGGNVTSVLPGSYNTTMVYVGSGDGASIVTGSSTELFVLSTENQGNGPDGISVLTPAGTPTAYYPYGVVPKVTTTAGRPGNQVWSGNHLYFTQSDSDGSDVAIGRVNRDGTELNRAWLTAPKVHQIAIGSMPAAAPAATPPAVKPTLKTTTIKKQTLYRMVNKLPETTVDCTTSNSQTLKSCKVEILVSNSRLKAGRAGTGKTVLVGTGTGTATAGRTTISVKVRITNKRARAILKKGGTLKATIRITATSTADQTSTASKATTLKAAKKKGKAAYRR